MSLNPVKQLRQYQRARVCPSGQFIKEFPHIKNTIVTIRSVYQKEPELIYSVYEYEYLGFRHSSLFPLDSYEPGQKMFFNPWPGCNLLPHLNKSVVTIKQKVPFGPESYLLEEGDNISVPAEYLYLLDDNSSDMENFINSIKSSI